MPREGYRSITIREDLYREIEASAKAAGISVPKYVEALYRTENGNDSDGLTDCTVQCTVHVPYNGDSNVSVPYNVPYMYRTKSDNDSDNLDDGANLEPRASERAGAQSSSSYLSPVERQKTARAREETAGIVRGIVAAWSEASSRSPLADSVTVSRNVLLAVEAHPELTLEDWTRGIEALASLPAARLDMLHARSLHQAMRTSPTGGAPMLALAADGYYEQATQKQTKEYFDGF